MRIGFGSILSSDNGWVPCGVSVSPSIAFALSAKTVETRHVDE